MSAKSRAIIWATFSAALFMTPAIASAQKLPAFTTDIVPIGLSLTIVNQKVTNRTGTTESNSFTINTGFNSSDFTDNLIALISSGGTFEVGVGPNGRCRTGETILPPISIPMEDVTHSSSMDEDSFTLTNDPDLSANWTISPFEVGSGGGGQNSSVSCINGVCTVTGSGVSTIINDNGSVIIQNNSVGGSSGPTPSDQMTFKASSTVPGIIPLPQTAVDVFFLYPDVSPSGGLLGGCIVLRSTSINNSTRSINGTTTVTRTYTAN
jgi:hypothetical protein